MKKNRKYLSIFVLVLAIGVCFGLFYKNERFESNNIKNSVEINGIDNNGMIAAVGCKIDLSDVSNGSLFWVQDACRISDGALKYDCYINESNKIHTCKNNNCSVFLDFEYVKGLIKLKDSAVGVSIDGCKTYAKDTVTFSCDSSTSSIKPTFCYKTSSSSSSTSKFTYSIGVANSIIKLGILLKPFLVKNLLIVVLVHAVKT